MFFPPSGTGHFCLHWRLRQRASVGAKGQVCATAGDSLGLWGGNRPDDTLILGSSFWEMARLVSFHPAEEVWASAGKHHSHLFQRWGSRTDPWPCCLNSRRCMKSHFQSHWIVEGTPIGFHCIFECATHQLVQKEFNGLETLQLLLIQKDSSGRVLPSPFPKKKVSHTSALQQKYYSVNTVALGMSMEKVKKPEVKRKAWYSCTDFAYTLNEPSLCQSSV